jgi:acyl carrier protein
VNASVRNIVETALKELRPEASIESLPPNANLREELDLDSMDFLNFVIGLHDATGIDVPEEDYRRLWTLTDCVGYLEEHGAGH